MFTDVYNDKKRGLWDECAVRERGSNGGPRKSWLDTIGGGYEEMGSLRRGYRWQGEMAWAGEGWYTAVLLPSQTI